METGPFSLEKQQRMLLRTLADIKVHLQHALETELNADFEIVKTTVTQLEDFVRDHVTAPEIRDYAGRIPNLIYIPGETTPFKIFGIQFLSSRSSREIIAPRSLLREAQDLKAHLANLEILVKMMDED